MSAEDISVGELAFRRLGFEGVGAGLALHFQSKEPELEGHCKMPFACWEAAFTTLRFFQLPSNGDGRVRRTSFILRRRCVQGSAIIRYRDRTLATLMAFPRRFTLPANGFSSGTDGGRMTRWEGKRESGRQDSLQVICTIMFTMCTEDYHAPVVRRGLTEGEKLYEIRRPYGRGKIRERTG